MKVSDYIEILKVKNERFDNEVDRSTSMLSIYLDEDIEVIEEMPISVVNRSIFEMNTFLSQEFTTGAESIPNNKITLGNFIDLETYLQEPENLPKVIAILFRKKRHNEWLHIVHEPMTFDITERGNEYLDKDIENYLKGIGGYVKFREQVLTMYKSIFGGDEIEEEIETEGLTPDEIKEIEKDEELRRQRAKYSWENFIYWLAGEDLTKVEQVLNFPILYALNMASMKKLYES